MTASTIDPLVLRPSGEIGKATNYPEFYDEVIAAINDHAELLDQVPVPIGFVSVQMAPYNARGDGVTDDRAAIMAAAQAANAQGAGLLFPKPSVGYRLSKYADMPNLNGLRIFGSGGAKIIFPSDDTTIATDSVATSDEMARSGFLLRNCSNVTIQGLTFVGGDSPNLNHNQGCAIYATKCVDINVDRVHATGGYGLFAQDASTGTTGTGDSLTVSAGVVTLVDSAGLFVDGHIDRQITIADPTNPTNSGTFLITAVISSTTITFANADGVTETSGFSWSIDDNDRGTRITNSHSFRQRGFARTGNDAVYQGCIFERPTTTLDVCGIGDSLAISGTTVTLTDAAARFLPQHDGKYITIASATSPGNNVTARVSYVSATQVTFTNASGVTELFTGTWWIANGEKAGLGAGSGALAKSSNTMTLTAATSSFGPEDDGKIVRIANATTAANEIAAVVTYVDATHIQFENSAGVAEDFSGIWTIDGFDNATSSAGNTHGSSHGVYIYAGRQNILIDGCTFLGIRTSSTKASGSALPIRNIRVTNCTFIECGECLQFGADDSQEHTGYRASGNTFVDCGSQRPGASLSHVVSILGSRGVAITDNVFVRTRDAIGFVDGRGVAGNTAVTATRYTAGVTQPLEDFTFSGNRTVSLPGSTSLGGSGAVFLDVRYVGQKAKYRTNGTLAKSGSTITLFDGAAKFAQQDVGKSITIVNSTNSNDVTATITAVLSSSSLTYTNSGSGGNGSAGTYRIQERSGKRGGECRISDNDFGDAAEIAIFAQENCGLSIVNNTFSNGLIDINGDVTPFIDGNRENSTYTLVPRIRLRAGTSWPIVGRNFLTNSAIGSAYGRAFGVGTGSTSFVDYPLLGTRGRCLPSDGKEEVVVAYGSGLVDGDTITVDPGGSAEVYTYKASGPTGNQFNSFAGLVALIAAQSGIDCTDYGTGFVNSAGSAADVTTTHLRIRAASATANTDGTLLVTSSALNPTALVLLRNTSSPNATSSGRGSGSTGPVADKVVVWSPLCSFDGCPTLAPDNADAAALMVTDSYYRLGNVSGLDGGSNDVIMVGETAGTEQWRWKL